MSVKRMVLSVTCLLFIHQNLPAKTIMNDTATLTYLVRQPVIKSDTTPMLILLHGVGSNEKDLFSFADHLPEDFLVISARAPITQRPGSYAWYSVDFSTGKPVFDFRQEEESRKILIHFIEEIKTRYAVNGPVYLCGFSQGAIMSYSIALTRPGLLKGIAVMSGRLLDEIQPFIAAKDQLKALRVFISHGVNDGVLQVAYARTALTFLKEKNIAPAYHEYNAGHEINALMLTDLIRWLKAK